MKVVVDEGVPRQLVGALAHAGLTAHRFKTDWRQIANGKLIAAADAEGYAVLLTNDKNMANQQSLKGKSIAVVALPTNKRSVIMDRIADIVDTVRRARPGDHIVMDIDGSRTARRIGLDGELFSETMPNLAPFRE